MCDDCDKCDEYGKCDSDSVTGVLSAVVVADAGQEAQAQVFRSALGLADGWATQVLLVDREADMEAAADGGGTTPASLRTGEYVGLPTLCLLLPTLCLLLPTLHQPFAYFY